jgi:hypothetical protein
MEANLIQQPRIESFMAADAAEAINGKLYLMGGNIDTVFAPTFPTLVRFSFAAILKVPWGDTNRRFPVEGAVTTFDGDSLGWELRGEIEAGRPAGARVGGDISISLAAPVQFEASESVQFLLALKFAGDESAIPMRVLAMPGPPFQVGPASSD